MDCLRFCAGGEVFSVNYKENIPLSQHVKFLSTTLNRMWFWMMPRSRLWVTRAPVLAWGLGQLLSLQRHRRDHGVPAGQLLWEEPED